MLAFLPSLCLIEVVTGVPKLTENHTGTFKLSGSYWTIRHWFAEDAAAVKNGRWDGNFSGMSKTNAHITKSKLYIQMNYVMEH